MKPLPIQNHDRKTPVKRSLFALVLTCATASADSALRLPSVFDAKSRFDQAAIRAIVGEAAGQPRAMLAVASALRHRGSLQGVYGLNAPVTRNASPAVWARAAQAWARSACVDAARGCQYFGCAADRGYFVGTLHFHPVFTISTITFYKP